VRRSRAWSFGADQPPLSFEPQPNEAEGRQAGRDQLSEPPSGTETGFEAFKATLTLDWLPENPTPKNGIPLNVMPKSA
jgi:hypothetical protein